MPKTVTREAIFSAAFNLIAATVGAKTAERRFKTWSEVPAADQPALFFIQKTQHAQYQRGKPTKWTFTADAVLYVNSGGAPDAIPATQINAAVDALESALDQSPGLDSQTLGNLVSHCAINGDIITDEGVLGDQGVAIIPIEIVTA